MKNLFVIIFMLVSVVSEAQQISALTYNIKFDDRNDTVNNWEARKEFLISQLNYNHPDVFGIQEGLQHQLGDIKNGLEAYQYIGVARDDGKSKGEYSAIFYDTKKLKVLKNDTFWLSETPEKPSRGWDAALPRICTYGLFKELGSGEEFYVFNTHFDHIGDLARIESAKLILDRIKAINSEDLPVILTGDFNLQADATGIQYILEQLKDSHTEAGKNAFGPTGTFNGFHFSEPVTSKIDYVFINNGFQVLRSGILSDSFNCHYPSDHFPVFVALYFKK